MAEFKSKADYERWKRERQVQSEVGMNQRGGMAGAQSQQASSGVPVGLIITLILTVVAIAGAVFFGPNIWKQITSRMSADTIAATDWKVFASPDKTYEVEMPGIPQYSKEKKGPVSADTYSVSKGTSFFMTITLDIPEAERRGASEDQILNEARNGVTKGKVLSEEKINYGVFPGRRYRIEYETAQITLSQLYLVGNRIYIVGVRMPSDRIDGGDSARFLGSFKLTR